MKIGDRVYLGDNGFLGKQKQGKSMKKQNQKNHSLTRIQYQRAFSRAWDRDDDATISFLVHGFKLHGDRFIPLPGRK